MSHWLDDAARGLADGTHSRREVLRRGGAVAAGAVLSSVTGPLAAVTASARIRKSCLLVPCTSPERCCHDRDCWDPRREQCCADGHVCKESGETCCKGDCCDVRFEHCCQGKCVSKGRKCCGAGNEQLLCPRGEECCGKAEPVCYSPDRYRCCGEVACPRGTQCCGSNECYDPARRKCCPGRGTGVAAKSRSCKKDGVCCSGRVGGICCEKGERCCGPYGLCCKKDQECCGGKTCCAKGKCHNGVCKKGCGPGGTCPNGQACCGEGLPSEHCYDPTTTACCAPYCGDPGANPPCGSPTPGNPFAGCCPPGQCCNDCFHNTGVTRRAMCCPESVGGKPNFGCCGNTCCNNGGGNCGPDGNTCV